jgi:uracil phosphoribosyltransferase
MAPQLTVVHHAVLADRLTVLRDRNTSFPAFRHALYECSTILAVEAARQLHLPDTRRCSRAAAAPSTRWRT